MKKLNSSSKLFLAAFILLITTNLVVLTGVYINRSGETTSDTTLTQRELKLPYVMQEEISNISLRINYRTLKKTKRSPGVDWLDTTKLKELGLDTNKYIDSKNNEKESKEAFIVLEYDGEAYKESLKLAEEDFVANEILYNENKYSKGRERSYNRAKESLTSEQLSASRLFAIDAGLDYDKLRRKYTSKVSYIIVKGVVKLGQSSKDKSIYGYIQQLSIRNVYLPYRFKQVFKDVKTANNYKNRQSISPQYKVELKYGSRYEPWINSVQRIYKK
ncbi:DUF4824 family protein [Candidatus Sulfurimonas marisnigri]|uniref:DUF4824 family protein n=1 Tax=Candidatus Sulfurimonas marisnigri TaxID=2740405 RepID=A0A7S7RQT7_9BACT|nr:DUF4824 family protein [Candidatus Sulfurimonas marisnigri]QOY55767.1 DUF4824 family protein [Candidatus Sulfurimonas marisnigri]